MEREYGTGVRYWTVYAEDANDGYAGFDLYVIMDPAKTGSVKERRVARLLFWDAAGEFALEIFDAAIPLVIVEELIAETRAAITYK